ncbi:MAG TPA: hypothetical protein VI643_03125 [Planctomycetota bacterium]|nr:hypothetical protein [Planctomycetota bacterium]
MSAQGRSIPLELVRWGALAFCFICFVAYLTRDDTALNARQRFEGQRQAALFEARSLEREGRYLEAASKMQSLIAAYGRLDAGTQRHFKDACVEWKETLKRLSKAAHSVDETSARLERFLDKAGEQLLEFHPASAESLLRRSRWVLSCTSPRAEHAKALFFELEAKVRGAEDFDH